MAISLMKGLTIHLFMAGRRSCNSDHQRHDGSISAVVTLTTIFAVISGITFVIIYSPSKQPLIRDVSYGILIILQCAGILSCFLIPLLKKLGKIKAESNELTPAIKIRLKILCFFSLGCIVHFPSRVVRKVNDINGNVSYKNISKITSDAVNILYCPVQTIFLIVFAK